ncbi:hypothetical protein YASMINEVIRUS_177 [Yasminevirus sp. GU-2018]|uniref:Uncharacterized protein n=1 Tax=Yasminevirus sp. GU-2018 TaxID=2420051 RepID=A0A5K0U890_9VIRU|nr:hypothetical protein YASMINEVIRUS_177 [Yasminevirus sp. GU-2018]
MIGTLSITKSPLTLNFSDNLDSVATEVTSMKYYLNSTQPQKQLGIITFGYTGSEMQYINYYTDPDPTKVLSTYVLALTQLYDKIPSYKYIVIKVMVLVPANFYGNRILFDSVVATVSDLEKPLYYDDGNSINPFNFDAKGEVVWTAMTFRYDVKTGWCSCC